MLKLKNKKLIFPVAAALLLLILSFSVPATRPAFLSILKSPLYLFNAIKREFVGLILYHRNYVRNEQLQNENDFLKSRINSLNEIYIENARLKKLLSFKQQASFRVMPARVIGRSADSWASMVIIDKGSVSGLRRGMGVITYAGVVGRIFETSPSASKVLLLNDPTFGVSAIVQRTRQEGLVCGTLGSYLIMKYLPQDADIKVEDKIVTSGFNQAYPKGLLIGTVIEIGNEFSNLGRYAVVKPAANLSYVEELLVIIP